MKDLEFQIRKTNWSLYEVDHRLAKGVLRVIGLPSNIFKRYAYGVSQRQFAILTHAMIGFTNRDAKTPT